MKANIPQVLLDESNTDKQSNYIRLHQSDQEKNQIKIKNEFKDKDLSDDHTQLVDQALARPDLYRSIGVFWQDDEIVHIETLPFEHHGNYSDKRFFTLPLFDVRSSFYDKLYLLDFSKDHAKLYRVFPNTLESVSADFLDEFESITSRELEGEAPLQAHQADGYQMHGHQDNKKQEKATEGYIARLGKGLNSFIAGKKAQLMLASTGENAQLLKPHINESSLAYFHLDGSIEKSTPAQILEKIHTASTQQVEGYLEKLKDSVDITASDKLQEESFSNIIAQVKQSKIAHLYVGDLGLHDSDYTNPISAPGANYISHEVLRYGGEVSYYPGMQFDFSDNNLVFKFRFDN